MEALGAMEKAKASSSTKLRKNRSWEKVRKISQEGKAAKKLVKNLSKTAGRKKRGFTEGSAITTSREARSNSRSTRKKT